MIIRVQRSIRLLSLVAVLCAASLACGASEPGSFVLPLVGMPEDAVYGQAVLETLAGAAETVNVLLSSVSLEDNPLLPALAGAAARGVRVRALLDASDWATEITDKHTPVLSYLREHGVEARFDDPEVTLHAKLLIADGRIVILGSSNWNRYALTEHRQADVLIEEPSIAAFYEDYFDVLWEGTMGNRGTEIELPSDFGQVPAVLPLADLPDSLSYARVLLELLHQASESIHVSMYRMSYYAGYGDSTANELLQALIDAAHRGLDVKVLIDDCAYYADSAQANLMAAMMLLGHGVEVRMDDATLTTHTKLVVMDGGTVMLGSTNWNYYALEQNCETDVAFVRLVDVAAAFESYFRVLWASGREL
jgi:phosphatidylserine/phosphatidylglycerophosphate/cardiolipin synthase-like enzyme